jgi:uncharacterized membrane protein YccC
MTSVAAPPVSRPVRAWSAPGAWIRAKDPGYLAVKRSVRAAIFMPAVFGLAHVAFTNGQVSLFAAFGAFALLLLVDFTGPPAIRFGSYAALFGVGCGFIALGTFVSTDKVAAVIAMALTGFAVLYGGIVAPQIATGATAALLLFVLPVAVAQPASAIGPRLLGWALAATFCIPACLFLWPTPWHDNLRRRLSATLSALARVAEAEARADGVAAREAHAALTAKLQALRTQFSSTPYPPTGAASGALALSKLVGRVEWVAGNAIISGDGVGTFDPEVRSLVASAAETLRGCADLVCDGAGHPVRDRRSVEVVVESLRRLDVQIRAELDTDLSMLLGEGSDDTPAALDAQSSLPARGPQPAEAERSFVSVLDPSFHAQALGIATEMAADAVLASAGADTVVDRRLGMGFDSVPHNTAYRIASLFSFRSVWFRNALRGAAGLGLAVAVVEVTNVSHGFWVVLGTLSVLRSNALGTGATVLRAIAGTAVGVVVGSAVMVGVSDHQVLLWVLLPLAVLLAGAAPSMVSFAAGQAGFTLVVVILFNIIQPLGWRVGLTRIEDVAIGCAVSIVVGVLFWPRGATAALGRALSASFIANSGYLEEAVDRLTTTNRHVDTGPSGQASHSAYLLLDDAFRQYLAERGAKVVSVETVARLFTGANRIRLAAHTLSTLSVAQLEPGETEIESVAVAGAVLRDMYAQSHRWYQEFAQVLGDQRATLDDPPGHDRILHDVLRTAFEDARAQRRADRLRITLQMLWADELLENQDQIQADLATSADLFMRRRRRAALV